MPTTASGPIYQTGVEAIQASGRSTAVRLGTENDEISDIHELEIQAVSGQGIATDPWVMPAPCAGASVLLADRSPRLDCRVQVMELIVKRALGRRKEGQEGADILYFYDQTGWPCDRDHWAPIRMTDATRCDL